MTRKKDRASLTVRLAEDSDVEALLRWRNQPHVRASMVTQDEIQPAAHRAWWKKSKDDRSRRVLVLEADGLPVAVLTYFDIVENEEAWWGFYLTDMMPAGLDELTVWMDIESLALRYAFERLKVRNLYCETRSGNAPVLLLHERFGLETLPSDEFPNAVKHDLVVKRTTSKAYEAGKSRLLTPGAATARLPDDPHAPKAARLVFIGSANWDDVAAGVAASVQTYCELALEVEVPPFGQGMMALLNPDSSLSRDAPDYIVFAERIEDFLQPLDTPSAGDIAAVEDRFAEYLERIRQLRSATPAHFFVHNLSLVRPHAQSLRDRSNRQAAWTSLIDRLNGQLAALCEALPDCTLLPLSGVIDDIGQAAADPGKYWLLARFPYGPRFTPAYHRLLCGALMALHGLTARALVLDLDNTLWGGVVGDDGTFGLSLGSDYPGNQFVAFQRFVKSLVDCGIVLAVCSKNTEEVALGPFREHPDMVLSQDDLVAYRINWNPKSQNIAEIAKLLDLGLGSLMFLDDNPMERGEVRQNLPGLIVPELPADVSEWPRFLASHPALCMLRLLDEDKDRAKKYKIRNQIRQAEKGAGDRHDFLRDLGMKITIAELDRATRARAVQLIAKTNQFNTTTIRYSERDLDAILEAGGDVLTVRIEDRFGSNEIIAVLVITYGLAASKAARIESFVMSCRVLGRGVETAVLAELCRRAAARGCDTLLGLVTVTQRNEPCRDVYARHGFVETESGVYSLPLNAPVAFPDWFEYA